ncbi:MAG: hypothetical protein ACOYEL_06880 [Saccharofermentanales bacterium]|jgi:hypothetical protein
MMAVQTGQKVVGYRITREAKRAFRYRYTCGHCGRQTNWYGGIVKGLDSLTKRGSHSKFSTEEVIATQKQAVNNLSDKIQKIEEEMQCMHDRAYKGPIPAKSLIFLGRNLKEADSCPYCGAVQPWKEQVFTSAGWWVLGFFFIGLMVSMTIGLSFHLDGTGLAGWFNSLTPIVAVMAAGFFIGRARRKKQISKYLEDVADTARATVLEIEWGNIIHSDVL